MEFKALLCRPSLDLRSGAGQLLHAQLLGLEAAGIPAAIACERGALKFWLRARRWPRRQSGAAIERLRADGWLIVDHGMTLPDAEIVYVHNLVSEMQRHVPRGDTAAVERERAFFERLDAATLVVANSDLVKRAIVRDFALADERIAVLHPGYDAQRFNLDRSRALRDAARRMLGMEATVPLVGLVTSGDFAKRGLEIFLDAATRLAAARPDVRFLVVGSKSLPSFAADHALVRGGRLQHRPKSGAPESWFAALDLFLYTARFEEFGMVVSEAQAMGVPVLTSRRVGASECLPPEYAPWLLDEPDVGRFVENALRLLDDSLQRALLVDAAARTVGRYDRNAYVRGTAELLRERQKRRLK